LEQNYCHRWNMGTRFWTTTEISVLSVEACNFSWPNKMPPPTVGS
jgi:hypothetical protein